jgi:virulence factor Mce-like protein
MNRRAATSRLRALAGDTLVIGLVALAISAVALLVAFQAQNGLPFQSVYRVHVQVPDAAKLSKNADVRIGGARVGQVLAIHAEPAGRNHPPFAQLDLALNRDVGPLPADTTAEVRLASVLGGKFLDLVPGHSARKIQADGTLPLRNGLPSIDTDTALQIFNPASRRHIRALISELGVAFAGRGTSINEFIGASAQALPHAQRFLRVLVSPRTDLPGLISGFADAARTFAPIAPQLARVIDRSARAFGAVDAAGSTLDQALANAPGAEKSSTDLLVTLRPVLDDAAAVTRELQPAGAILPQTLRRVDTSMRAAIPVASKVTRLAPGIDAALRAVDQFSSDPASMGAVKGLKGTDLATFGGSAFIGLGAILKTVAAAQLHCNVAGIWMRNLASVSSEGDAGGNWLRMIPIFQNAQTTHNAAPDPDLHANFYPHENANECESGNEPYTPGQLIGNPPGNQSKKVEVTPPTGDGG